MSREKANYRKAPSCRRSCRYCDHHVLQNFISPYCNEHKFYCWDEPNDRICDLYTDREYHTIKTDANSGNLDGNWVLSPQREIEYLKGELKIACKYLEEAKRKWSPSTTNSDVDVFLQKWGNKEDGK